MDKIKAFFARNKLDVIIVACVLGLALVVVMFASVLGKLEETNTGRENAVQELLKDNNAQTRMLTDQNKTLERLLTQNRVLTERINCLLDIHIEGREPTDSECRNGDDPAPQSSLNNDPEPSPSRPEDKNNNTNTNGGGEEPEEPSLLDRLTAPIRSILGL